VPLPSGLLQIRGNRSVTSDDFYISCHLYPAHYYLLERVRPFECPCPGL